MLDRDLKILSRFDKEKLWTDINKKVVRLKTIHTIGIVSSIAASLLIAVLLVHHHIGENEERIVKSQISNISKSAPILINAAGKKIALNKTQIDHTANTIFLDSLYNSKIEGKDANIPAKNKYNMLMIPRGAEFKLILSDSTIVWMNSGSKIKYPKSFNGDCRRVFMEGEAYFQVTKNKKKPFVVECGDFKVKVLGTKFNVSNYKDDDFSHVTLESGKVQVNKGKIKKILAPSQQAYMGNGNINVRKVNVGSYISWRGTNFIFHEETLENIMKKLSRWYDVEVFYKNEDIRDIHLTCRILKYGNIEEVMELIKRVANIKYQINKRCVVIGEV